jgi:dephospho-CoA kinase
MEKVLFIGVTGNFGTGKSTVCKIIEEFGYPIIYSDSLAKELMVKNEELKKRIIENFGEEAYLEDGSLNRKWLAEKVFSNSPESEQILARLNAIVHPFVLDETEKIITRLIEEGNRMIFFESALIFEANIQVLFDYIILVDSKKEKIYERMETLGKFSKEDVDLRLQRQIPAKEKYNSVDFIIQNNGSLEELKTNVKLILEMLEELSKT